MSKFALSFFISYFVTILVTLFSDAAYGIYLYEIVYFINPTQRWWYGALPHLRYPFIIGICTFFSYFINHRKKSRNKFFDIPHNRWYVAMAVLMLLVSFIAVTPESHWQSYQGYLKVLLIIFLLHKIIDTPQRFEKMMWAFLIGQFYLGWLAHTTGRTGFGRLEGIGPSDTGSDANMVGAVFVTSVPILIFYLIQAKRKWQKGLSLIFFVYVMDGIILLNSRGAFLGLITGVSYMAYYVFFKRVKEKRFKRQMAVGLVMGILVFLYLADVTFWERMNTLTTVEVGKEGLEGASGGTTRTFFWMKAIELVKEYPFGVGASGYIYLSPNFIPEQFLTGGVRAVHSIWFETLSEFGYLGLIILLGYVISYFSLMRDVRSYALETDNHYLYYQAVSLSAALIGFLTASTFLNRLFSEMLYWIPAFGACMANIFVIKIRNKNL